MTTGGPPSALDPALADPSASADHDALSKLGSLASSTVSSPTATSGRSRGRRDGRPSRWDRPPEPHDWRWAVGGIGRVLISVGILMFAFVGYQLYGTGIQTAQAQNRLEDEFADLLATKDTGTTEVATEITTAATAVPETVASTIADEPAVVEPVPSTVPPAAFVPPAQGDPVAQILIPSIDVAKIVIEGVRTSDLEDGPGHFPETPLPGQFGNAAIAGHRTTHGQPFNRIDELQVGDDIVVETLAGTYTYVVSGQVIVSPNDYQLVIPTTDPSVATLTLTSCHPKFSAKQRIVVTAVLDPARSDTVTERYLPTTRDPAAPAVIPGDESTDTTEPSEPSEPSAPGTTIAVDATVPVATDPATATTGPATATTETGTQPDDAASSGQDLFENRWFSDPGAFSQVGLWGLALTLVALAATAISRRARRNLVGALVGFAPFIVVLYFWFENVNRLLPPNL